MSLRCRCGQPKDFAKFFTRSEDFHVSPRVWSRGNMGETKFLLLSLQKAKLEKVFGEYPTGS